ncbi:MAG: outer membrane protein transport protein [Kofleriaceae bacterium]|jgi:long-subunit fatty acid transport protein|nr:outer membrane protein transport protein [Kofleriaceae bacterium]MBP6836304.1 outer membrane protein transport protein [Kofleriaceae bacterium]
MVRARSSVVVLLPGALTLAVTTAVAVAPAHAGGFGIPEMGTRRQGMAAVIGRPDEPSAVFHNPAGLILLPGVHLYLSAGLALNDTEFQLRPWPNSELVITEPVDAEGYYPAVEPTRAFAVIPMLAATAELLPGRLVGALSVYVGNGAGAKFADDAVTRYHAVEGYVVAPQVQLSAAYRVHRAITVGASAGAINLIIKGERKFFPFLAGQDVRSVAGTNPTLELDGSAWAPAWNVGLLAAPIPGLTLGAAVIGRIDATVSGPLTVTYDQDASVPGDQIIGSHETTQLLPWTFHAGANYDAHPSVEVGTELRYWLYRQYDEQRSDIDGVIFLRELVTEKNYRDSYQVSGGVRVHDLAAAPGLELMLGLHYDRTPAPPQNITFDAPSFTHVGLHSGLRYQRGRYRVGLAFQHFRYAVPDVTDSVTTPPTNFRGRSHNNITSLQLEASFGDGARR